MRLFIQQPKSRPSMAEVYRLLLEVKETLQSENAGELEPELASEPHSSDIPVVSTMSFATDEPMESSLKAEDVTAAADIRANANVAMRSGSSSGTPSYRPTAADELSISVISYGN